MASKSAMIDSPGKSGAPKAASKIRFSATLLQPKATVGSKGYDGFAIALVTTD